VLDGGFDEIAWCKVPDDFVVLDSALFKSSKDLNPIGYTKKFNHKSTTSQ
jgi:hypothetical protein